MNDLNLLRQKIELIDNKMRELFIERMKVSVQIGKVKQEQSLPVLDQKREDDLLLKYQNLLDNEKLWPYYKQFMKEIMKLSKDIQNG